MHNSKKNETGLLVQKFIKSMD